MKKIVSIVKQRQNTGIKSIIPVAPKNINGIIVAQKLDFWSLEGSLKSRIKLTDRELRSTRGAFEKEWASS